MPVKRMRGPRALIIVATGVGVIVGLTLRTAQRTGRVLPGAVDPELDIGLRLVCAATALAAFTLAYLAFARKRDEPLALASLPGLIVTGVVLRYLIVTLPGIARYEPAAKLSPGPGAWMLLAAGIAMAATGLAAAFSVKRGEP